MDATPEQWAEYKLGQRRGTFDGFNGPHKRFSEGHSFYALGYSNAYEQVIRFSHEETDEAN